MQLLGFGQTEARAKIYRSPSREEGISPAVSVMAGQD